MTKERVGVVIGAAGGIGSACAAALGDSADRLLLVDLRPTADADRLPNAEDCEADIATEEGRQAVRTRLERAGGRIAWVVLASGEPLRESFQAASAAAVERCFAVNLVAPTLLVRQLLELSWEDNGQLVVIGSISASRALPNRTVYASAKAGLEHFARSLSVELAGRRLRCNVVAPGVVDTDFLGTDRSVLDEWVSHHVPMQRLGDRSEVAAVVRFLIRDAPEYLNGARISVDGATEAMG
jgi:NAD(P)-dependent dehydrogenase (short-subunit alcohol dehydrogenase family)